MTSTPAGLIRTERRGVAFLIGLDRPGLRNALDRATVAQFHAALDEAGMEPSVVVVHSTTPGIFASGADLRELLERGADDALQRINIDLFDRLERHRWPTIAAVDGAAVGAGCELALACDLRVCSPRARFAQPETSLGVLAGAGGNWRLPQLVGLAAARSMLYLGTILTAEEAKELRLVDVLADDSLGASLSMAGRIGERSWRALELTKLALASHRPSSAAIDVVAQALLFESSDKRARIKAFLDDGKRSAGAKRTEENRASS